jgi:hypothetical protein
VPHWEVPTSFSGPRGRHFSLSLSFVSVARTLSHRLKFTFFCLGLDERKVFHFFITFLRVTISSSIFKKSLVVAALLIAYAPHVPLLFSPALSMVDEFGRALSQQITQSVLCEALETKHNEQFTLSLLPPLAAFSLQSLIDQISSWKPMVVVSFVLRHKKGWRCCAVYRASHKEFGNLQHKSGGKQEAGSLS